MDILEILGKINKVLWGPPSLILLFGTGLFLTIVLKGLQFRRLMYGLSRVWQRRQQRRGCRRGSERILRL